MGAQEREVKGRSSGDPEINQAQQGLMPAGVAGDQSIPNREIDLSSIEFRYANIEQDAQAVADIWGGDAKDHLSGMAPPPNKTVKNIERYRRKYEKDVIIPVRDEILEKFGNNPNYSIIVAEDKVSRTVVGAVVVGGLSTGGGIRNPSIEKLAVKSEARRKGIAIRLVRAATADIFTRKKASGEYAFATASAGVILIPGDEAKLFIPGVGMIGITKEVQGVINLFHSEGYEVRHLARGNCVSWDSGSDAFVDRDTANIARFIDRTDIKTREELEKYLPSKAPRNGQKSAN
ncbi:MAG: GNAT family N-acetyltransferase [Patescibacteria group bacterium]